MNVAQAIQALREHSDQVQDPIAPYLLERPVGSVVKWLRAPELEPWQERSNQEWESLISEENEPVEAAKLLLDWWEDQHQADVKKSGEEEEKGLPDSERMSR